MLGGSCQHLPSGYFRIFHGSLHNPIILQVDGMRVEIDKDKERKITAAEKLSIEGTYLLIPANEERCCAEGIFSLSVHCSEVRCPFLDVYRLSWSLPGSLLSNLGPYPPFSPLPKEQAHLFSELLKNHNGLMQSGECDSLLYSFSHKPVLWAFHLVSTLSYALGFLFPPLAIII